MLYVIESEVVNAKVPPLVSLRALEEAEAVVLVNPITQDARVWKWRSGVAPPAQYIVGEQRMALWQVFDALIREIARQDTVHDTAPYGDNRDSVRVALAAMQDELDESLAAFHHERREPPNNERWEMTVSEAIQAAALACRLARDLRWRGSAS